MEVRVLGPLEVQSDGGPVQLAGARQQALLALLVVHAPAAVGRETLIDLLWGEAAPTSAVNAVQVYVSQLRKALGREHIETVGGGYRLRLDRQAVDVWRFVDLLESATAHFRAARADSARDELVACLALWRGQAYAGLTDVDALSIESTRLEQLRLTALERRLDIDLQAGRHLDVLGELQRLTAEHPLHERFWAQLMRSLYMAGRQSDALEAYRRLRQLLIDELGIEPEPELQELERAVLRQDPQLSASAAPFLAPLPAELAAPGPTFVGRAEDLAWLVSALDRAEAGEAVVVAVEGPPGIGKTRLIAELAAIARSRRLSLVYGVALEGLAAAADERADVVLTVADELDQLPAAAAPQLAALLAEPRPGRLLLLSYSSAVAPLPVRVVLTSAVGDGAVLQRHLQRLSVDDVAEVARRYAPTAEATDVRDFAATAPGAPLAVHEAASAWAVSQAAARVDAAAQVLPATQARIEHARVEVVSGVLDAQRAQDLRRAHLARTGQGRSPYVGLAAYEADDAAFFFGREQLVAELLARLLHNRLLLIVGPSGSGKSSLARAGLLPALAAGALPGSLTWTSIVVTPGQRPEEVLEQAVQQAGGPQHLVVVDQLEECFTLADEQSRARFGQRLASVLEDDGIRVIATLRGDFFARCSEWPTLTSRLTDATILAGPMTQAELRRVIEHPPLLAGIQLEPGLADLVLNDCGDQPGVLPLLSTALYELWERRDGTKLTLTAYAQSGGVIGAINQLAEGTYARLEAGERTIARRMMLRLAEPSGVHRYVRRRAHVDELAPATDPRSRHVLDILIGRRLLTRHEDAVEVAHEALFSEWPRLRDWLQEDAEARRLRSQLTPAALAWDSAGRPESDLLRGPRLAAGLELAHKSEATLTDTEHAFLAASEQHDQAERVEQRRRLRRMRILAAGLAALVALTAVTAVIAVEQRATAGANATRADARRVAAQALLEGQADRALLLAAHAVRLDDNADTRAGLLSVLQRTQPLVAVLRSNEGELLTSAVSPDGALVAVHGGEEVLIVNARTGSTRSRLAPEAPAGLAFSPDSMRLAVAVQDGARIYDLTEQADAATVLPVPHGAASLAFTSTGDHLVIAGNTPEGDGWSASTWDTRTGQRVADLATAQPERVTHVSRLTSGEMVLEAAVASLVVDATGTEVLGSALPTQRPVTQALDAAAVSPDGRRVAVSQGNGLVAVLDRATGQPLGEAPGHRGHVTAVTWAADGHSFATTSDDGTAIIWAAAPLARRFELRGHSGRIADAQFSPDSSRLYTTGVDGLLLAWDATGSTGLSRQLAPTAVEPGLFSLGDQVVVPPDGENLIVAESYMEEGAGSADAGPPDHSWRLRVCSKSRLVCPPRGQRLSGNVGRVSASDDGRRILVAVDPDTDGGQPPSWHLLDGDGRKVSMFTADVGQAGAMTPVVSPDGSLVAAIRDEMHAVGIWDTGGMHHRAWIPLAPLDAEEAAFGSLTVAAFSPDGQYLVIPDFDGDALVIDVDREAEVTKLRHPRGVPLSDVTFSPDGEVVAIGTADGATLVWRTDDWSAAGSVPPRLTSQVSVAFSPDGSHLALAGGDDVIVTDPSADFRVRHRYAVAHTIGTQVEFLDRKRLLTFSLPEGPMQVWPVEVDDWITYACSIVRRELTAPEWREAVGDREQAPVCRPE